MSTLTPVHLLRALIKQPAPLAAQPPRAPPRRAEQPRAPVPTDDERRLAVAKRQAAAICRAAAKARGEIVDEPEPLDPTVAAILLSGRRRRGECP